MRSTGQCYRCKCEVWITDALYEAATHSPGVIEFFCGYGHSQVFVKGESEEQKLRRERDRLKQRVAERDDMIAAIELRRRAAVGQVTKFKNRVWHGVCPCCNRTFENLARHMASKHADYAKDKSSDENPHPNPAESAARV
jgi:hypothetical protein